MRVDGVALIPKCAECEAVWLAADDERWRAYHAGDDEPAELVFYCPKCGAGVRRRLRAAASGYVPLAHAHHGGVNGQDLRSARRMVVRR